VVPCFPDAAGTIAEGTEEDEGLAMTPEQLETRIAALLDTCTYTVYNYTRRGLFDRDKLIVLTLLTFQILLRSGSIDATEYEALCKGGRSAAPPPVTDDLSRCDACAFVATMVRPCMFSEMLTCDLQS
jgi:dynein heavy chain